MGTSHTQVCGMNLQDTAVRIGYSIINFLFTGIPFPVCMCTFLYGGLLQTLWSSKLPRGSTITTSELSTTPSFFKRGQEPVQSLGPVLAPK